MRIILDIDDISDAQKCLSLALEQQRQDAEADFGYWSSSDPNFTGYVRWTKTGVSVRGRRKFAETLRSAPFPTSPET